MKTESGADLDFYINEDTAWLRRAVSWVVNIVVVLACAWFLVYGYGARWKSQQFHATGLDGGDVVLTDRITYVVSVPGVLTS